MKFQTTYTEKEAEELERSYNSPDSKQLVSPDWTKYLLVTHPIEFITTVGRVNGKIIVDVAPFATCLDTSYYPPYVTISCNLKQHSVQNKNQNGRLMNTLCNIKQNGLFVVNVPGKELLNVLNILAYPDGLQLFWCFLAICT